MEETNLKTILFKAAGDVSKKIVESGENTDMVLGEWLALTSVIDAAGLMEEFVRWKNENELGGKHDHN